MRRSRIRAHRRARARAHQHLAASSAHNGPRPFGWDFTEDRTLRINPAEAAVVRECVQRVLAGDGITGARVVDAWVRADVETRKRFIRLLGMRITIDRVGPGNARTYDPTSVAIAWDAA